MTRREFIISLGVTAAAASSIEAFAQDDDTSHRIP
jgi:hypothetical protein